MGAFKDLARKAYEVKRTGYVAENRKQYCPELAGEFFSEQFNMTPDSVNGPVIRVDGMTLLYKWNEFGLAIFSILGKCPKCGEEAESGPVVTLGHAGEVLENFQVGFNYYYCRPHLNGAITRGSGLGAMLDRFAAAV